MRAAAAHFVVSSRRVRPRSWCVLLVIAQGGCGWLPPDSPATKPAEDPDAALLHDWKITGHLLGPHAVISEADAAGFHGRTIAVTPTGYSSPWSGSCDDASRQRAPRALADVAADLELTGGRVGDLGLVEPITRYVLSCVHGSAPPLQLYLGSGHAATCWSGVCYALSTAF